MNVQTYLFFDGSCRHAIELYRQAFGANLLFQVPYSQAPEEIRVVGKDDLVFHATLRIGETLLNLSDDLQNEKGRFGGFALLVHLESGNAVDAALQILSAGGSVELPPQQTFWAERYAIAIDPFGICWKLQYSSQSDPR